MKKNNDETCLAIFYLSFIICVLCMLLNFAGPPSGYDSNHCSELTKQPTTYPAHVLATEPWGKAWKAERDEWERGRQRELDSGWRELCRKGREWEKKYRV